jgi:hypothetical protein
MALEQLKNALSAYGTNLYRDGSSYHPSRATMALSGRTHYVDPDTMKYFGCRINYCSIDVNGLYCWILESVSHPSMGRVHRFVLFDVFGTVLTERGDMLRKTRRQAEKDKEAFLGSFDPIAHTEKALRENIARDMRKCTESLGYLDHAAITI